MTLWFEGMSHLGQGLALFLCFSVGQGQILIHQLLCLIFPPLM